MNGYLLDTPIWLWYQQGESQRFSPEVMEELERRQQAGQLFVSAISVLEIARLVASQQFSLGVSVEEFVAIGTADDGFRLLDLSVSVLIGSTRLPEDFHRDPADRILAATARLHDLTLLTQDKRILAYAKRGFLKAAKL